MLSVRCSFVKLSSLHQLKPVIWSTNFPRWPPPAHQPQADETERTTPAPRVPVPSAKAPRNHRAPHPRENTLGIVDMSRQRAQRTRSQPLLVYEGKPCRRGRPTHGNRPASRYSSPHECSDHRSPSAKARQHRLLGAQVRRIQPLTTIALRSVVVFPRSMKIVTGKFTPRSARSRRQCWSTLQRTSSGALKTPQPTFDEVNLRSKLSESIK